MDLTLRSPRIADAPALAAISADGFDTYVAFAPAGWAPPPDTRAMFERDLLRQMGQASSWGMLAEADGEIAGHAAFVPASASGVPVDDPRLAHLWQLFVAPAVLGRRRRDHAARRGGPRGRRARLHADAAVHAGRPGPRAALLRARGLDARGPRAGLAAGPRGRRVPPAGQRRRRMTGGDAGARGTRLGACYQACSVPQCGQSTEVDTAAVKANPHMQE